MKNRNEEIDEMIKEALSEEEAKFFEEMGEQSMQEMIGELFKGKLRWLNILSMIVQPLLFGVAVYCAVHFFNAEETQMMIKWGAGAFLFMFASSYMKLFQWMQMDKNALLREIKRMELQIVSLSAKIDTADTKQDRN